METKKDPYTEDELREEMEIAESIFLSESRNFKLAKLAIRTQPKQEDREKARVARDEALGECNYVLDRWLDYRDQLEVQASNAT